MLVEGGLSDRKVSATSILYGAMVWCGFSPDGRGTDRTIESFRRRHVDLTARCSAGSPMSEFWVCTAQDAFGRGSDRPQPLYFNRT